MKNINFEKAFGIFAAFALVASITAMSFDTPKEMDAFRANELITALAESPEGYFDAVSGIYEKTFTKDTITDAANDTLYLPSSMRPVISNFLHCVNVTRTNISGTTNLAIKVEESTYRYSGSTPPTAGWTTAINTVGGAADTDATTATTELIKLSDSYGMNYRVIIDGTGTQSSSYVIRWVLKKRT